MTSIAHSNFQLKRIKDTFVLVNLFAGTLNYTLTKTGCNVNTTESTTGEVLEGESITLSIISDGYYELNVNGTLVYFNSLSNYRNRLIELVAEAVCVHCNCKPVNCLPAEAVSCLKNQSLFNFIQVYINLVKPYSLSSPSTTNPFLFSFYENTLYANKCELIEGLCKQLFSTSLTGESKVNTELFNYFIAVYYLGLYSYDTNNINTSILSEEEITEELAYLDKVYQYKSIKKCIRHLGIDVEDIVNMDMSEVNVYYWQAEIGDTLSSVLALISSAYLDTKNVEPFEVFQEGKVVNYSSIGRIVFAIKETVLQNFIIEDSLGNNVTDDFDVEYIAPLQCVLYVSKSIYTHSNIFFKFKGTGVLGCTNPPLNPIVEGIFTNTFNNTFN